jgi:hypothetical protein
MYNMDGRDRDPAIDKGFHIQKVIKVDKSTPDIGSVIYKDPLISL